MLGVDKVRPYAKAVVAFVAPAATVLTSAVQQSSAGGEAITGGEWVTAVCACFLTGGLVFAVPNSEARGLIGRHDKD